MFNHTQTPPTSVLTRPVTAITNARKLDFTVLAAIFVVSRLIYFGVGVRPDPSPLSNFWQYLDPELLRHSLWQSLLYLREQPPGFNLFLGVILKLFSQDGASVFIIVYWLLGLALGFSLFALMVDLHVRRPIALLVTGGFLVSPVTVLYENWLLYSFPVSALLGISAWALYRFLRDRHSSHAAIFFCCLFLVASIRGIYHLLWFLLIAAALIVVARSDWRKIVLAGGLPAVLLTAIYAKSFVLFGDFIIGSQTFAKTGYADIVQTQVTPEFLRNLADKGTISGILLLPAEISEIERYAPFVPQPALTGHAALDQVRKSSGEVNWNSLWMAQIAEKLYKDARIVTKLYPDLYFNQLVHNFKVYLWPADYTYPFLPHLRGRASDAVRLIGILKWYDCLTTGIFDTHGHPWITLLVLPACVLVGIIELLAWLRKRAFDSQIVNARKITILFALFNIGYCGAVTIMLVKGDQNRYRDEVSALYAILLGLLLTAVWQRTKMFRARLAANLVEGRR